MNQNEQTIQRFYSAFAAGDYKTMNSCYAEHVVFFDPVFEDLVDDEVRLMWQMLCSRASDLTIEFSGVEAPDEYGNCNWVARYTFSRTKRKVVNRIRAHMKFENGRIVEHSDAFNLASWCRQAMGVPGVLFGGMSWFQRKVRRAAQQSLHDYILSNQTKNDS